jgi:hypothetical protein
MPRQSVEQLAIRSIPELDRLIAQARCCQCLTIGRDGKAVDAGMSRASPDDIGCVLTEKSQR